MAGKTINISLILWLALGFSGCDRSSQSAATEPLPRTVRTLTINSEQYRSDRQFTGVVDASRKVDLAFRVSGTLQKLDVQEGDSVHSGQLLAALDDTDFHIRLRAVSADFERAKADFERARALSEKQLISRADLDRLQAQFLVAQAELEKARQELAYTEIHAPFDGVIARRYVENLSEITARMPVLALVDLDSMVVIIDVPESVMIHARREGERPELYAVFANYEEQQFPLRIKEAATQADPGSQTYKVTLSLPTIAELNILPGMSASVGVRNTGENAAVTGAVVYLPAQAVLEDQSNRYVFVAIPGGEGENASIERREVSIGDVSRYGIQITGGLNDGDRVVTAGMSQLYSGMAVRLEAEPAGE